MTLTIALVPLDERPVNTKYPQMLAAIAGASVLLPPEHARGLQRQPADLWVVSKWLRESVESKSASAAIVSCDYLAYGNLINARISNDSAAYAISRLALLEELGEKTPIHAFSLITRVANSDDIVEEPSYWKVWGTKFARYARLKHQSESTHLTDGEQSQLFELSRQLPTDYKSDWLKRRLRNHAVNLSLVDLASRGRITSLLLTSDDTAPFGFPTRERNWVRSWLEMIGDATPSNIQMHPGADEVGSALLAKLVNENAGNVPRVSILYSNPGDEMIVAPYEDRPVRETVVGQIEACGCKVVPSGEECDFVLAVVTPSPRRTDYRMDYLAPDRETRSAKYAEFLDKIQESQAAGTPVALADVAYPNGSDPLMSETLLAPERVGVASKLAAYGAWNTAGNTLGVVVAQAACALLSVGDPVRETAQRLFLTHRFLEDYGYQQRVRREARDFCDSQFGTRDPNPESNNQVSAVSEFIESRLNIILGELQESGIGTGVSIVRGSTRLPWRRTFEVDFDLEDPSVSQARHLPEAGRQG